MDIYVLNNAFRRTSIIDDFESLVWTERFQDLGDFELELKPSLEMKTLLSPGTKLSIKQSKRIMVVRHVEKKESGGKSTMLVSGPSLESILEDRGYAPTFHRENAAAGDAIKKYEIKHCLSASGGSSIPTTGWADDVPQNIPSNRMIWTRTAVEFADGGKTMEYILRRESYPKNRKKTTETVTWQLGDNLTTLPTGTWTTNRPSHPAGKTMWRRVITKYTKGESMMYYYVYGLASGSGVPEAPDQDGNTPYLHIAYANDTNGKDFSRTDPSVKKYIGFYRDYTQTDSTNVDTYEWVEISGKQKWVQDYLEGTPQAIIRNLWNQIVRDGAYSQLDKLDYLTTQVPFDPSTIPYPDRTIRITPGADSLLNIFQDLCKVYGLGFRMTTNAVFEDKIAFDVYSGSDLTSRQLARPAVIFSPDLENLTDIHEIKENEAKKTVACIVHMDGTAYVFSETDNPNAKAYDRRVIMVDVTDIELQEGEIFPNEEQIEAGRAALAEHKDSYMLDGEIDKMSDYIYGTHYDLGDVVEMRNDDGVVNIMRVTEQIFISDVEGDRAYPTLEMQELVLPGSWTSWEWAIDWENATGTWSQA